MHITESRLPSPQPLLAGAYVLLANLLTQNLRRASFHPPLYLQVSPQHPSAPSCFLWLPSDFFRLLIPLWVPPVCF